MRRACGGQAVMMSKSQNPEDKLEPHDQSSGYGQPPEAARFKRGQSGNPRGRPRNRRREAPYEAVLGQMVTIREEGTERKVTAAEAFYLQMLKRGLEGNTAAARAAIAAIEQVKERQDAEEPLIITIVRFGVDPGSVTRALEPLRMARKLDPYRDTARMALEPWLVESALARLEKKRLSLDEQKVIVKATRTPRKVKWPDWWVVRP